MCRCMCMRVCSSACVRGGVKRVCVPMCAQMHEMEEGLSKTLNREENHTDPLRGGAHNLEESWALYHGACGKRKIQ